MLAAAVAGVTTWALWPDPPRQREYLDTTACLLTDATGVTAQPAEQVWSAMLKTSATSRVMVQNLQVSGPQTTENAGTHLASLVSGRCNVIIAVGKVQIDAVTAHAGAYPQVRFLTVGGGSPAGNVRVLDSSADALRSEIADQLEALADAKS